MSFAMPFVLIFILGIPLLFWRFKKRAASAHHPLASLMHGAHSVRLLLYRSLPVLQMLALAALMIALAGPRIPQAALDPPRAGVAIMMTLDRSGSMGAYMDTPTGAMTRIDIVKNVFTDFATQRKNDLIGLVAFARYPETLSPLSASTDTLKGFLDVLELPQSREEDGTSIGDAVALATARLKAAGPQIKSRVLILLTDGLSNAGAIAPIDAAKTAAEAGIRIYTIGFGGEAFQLMPDGLSRMPLGDSFDSDTLQEMARITGGQFFAADSADHLKSIYLKIDALEKSSVTAPAQQRYDELYAIFALIALGLFLLERILVLSLFRRMET